MTEKIQEKDERTGPGEAEPTAAETSPEQTAALADNGEHDQLKDDIVAALKTVFDPGDSGRCL